MLMWIPEDHGTDVGGTLDEDYCRFCFRDGVFTHPHLSLDEMIDRIAARAPEMHLTPEQAATRGRRLLPRLKRWRDSTP
jgi:hypothetical protein